MKFSTAFIVVLAILEGAAASGGANHFVLRGLKTPDGETPAVETVCDSEKTDGNFGLCNAFCEAQDCDDQMPDYDKSCERILKNYRKTTGKLGPPCCFKLEWDTEHHNTDGGWKVSKGGMNIRFDIDDSANCGGSNDLTQYGTAAAKLSLCDDTEMSLTKIDGMVERQNANFELLNVVVDGILVLHAKAWEHSQRCEMAYPDIKTNNFPLQLTAGDHDILITFTTNDSLYHVGAFYEMEFGMEPM